jgi:hypothetical protein
VDGFRRTIREQGCEGYIQFKGEIPYTEMKSVLVGALAFIGMGTAAVEAASTGTPVIVPTAFAAEPESHGMLHELPFGNVGEYNSRLPKRKTSQILKELLTLPANDYLDLRKSSIEVSHRYNTDQVFLQWLELIKHPEEVGQARAPSSLAGHWLRWMIARWQIRIRRLLSS